MAIAADLKRDIDEMLPGVVASSSGIGEVVRFKASAVVAVWALAADVPSSTMAKPRMTPRFQKPLYQARLISLQYILSSTLMHTYLY